MTTVQTGKVVHTFLSIVAAPVAFPEAEYSIRGFIDAYKFYRPPVPISVLSFLRHDPISKLFYRIVLV